MLSLFECNSGDMSTMTIKSFDDVDGNESAELEFDYPDQKYLLTFKLSRADLKLFVQKLIEIL